MTPKKPEKRSTAAVRIVATPGTCGGRPRVDGTRIEVSLILQSIARGMSLTQVVAAYPTLKSVEAVQVALAWAAGQVGDAKGFRTGE